MLRVNQCSIAYFGLSADICGILIAYESGCSIVSGKRKGDGKRRTGMNEVFVYMDAYVRVWGEGVGRVG